MSNTPEVNVQRRRKGEKPTGQAVAPRRRDTGGGTGGMGGSSGGGTGGSSFGGGGGGLFKPTRGKMGGCGGIVAIIAIAVLYLLLSGDGGLGGDPGQAPIDQPPVTNAEPTQILATHTPRATRVPSTTGSGDTWLVMLYQDADDQVLEQDIYLDLNEAERVGSSENVTIVAQLDRFRGGFQGGEDWTSTRRYLVTQDDDFNSIGSELVDDLG
ncbi:MAG TPA: hypothetical protein VIH16_02740, partial [Bellilinea sp.]